MKSEEWKSIKLNDALECIIDYRGKTPKKSTSGIPLITAKIIKEGFLQKPNEFISEDTYRSWMTRGFPQKGDVLLTVEAPLGEVAQVKNEKIALAQRVVLLRGKKDIIDNHFLKYYLQSELGQFKLKERETGTTVTGIKQSELRKIEIEIPAISSQKKIGFILNSIDEKIELNRQTNQTLEAIAQTLFKQWFVNFNFPGATGKLQESELGMIPEGWKVGKLGEICKVQNGFAFKSKDFNESGENAVVKIKNISSNIVDINNTQYVSPEVIKKLDSKFEIKPGALLIAMTGAEVGKIGLVPFSKKKLYLNQRVGNFFQKIPNAKYYSYLLLSTDQYMNKIRNSALGSAQPNISSGAIENIKVVIPEYNLIETFGNALEPLFNKILFIHFENEITRLLRDSLLPRLMRGEINV